MVKIKVIKTRTKHECHACGMDIPAGSLVFKELKLNEAARTWQGKRDRWFYKHFSKTYYYHYSPDLPPDKVIKLSVGEFRAKVCAPLYY